MTISVFRGVYPLLLEKPIERIEYLVDHKLLVMVQLQQNEGFLKDMYAQRCRGLLAEKIARYGRHILEVRPSLLHQYCSRAMICFDFGIGYDVSI